VTTAFAGAVLDAEGRPFDRIRLTGLSATGHHGVYEHEKVEGQLFRADVVLHLDTRAAASGDDLARTVSYAGVAEDVVAVLAGSPADLVETVAERIAATILTHQDVVAVDVAVHKPQAPITVPFEDVEVVIRRDRVVVPVVAPPVRRPETHAMGPIPVGSVAPALIQGVHNRPAAEEPIALAPAPDVMPPSIPPTGAIAVEQRSAPEPPDAHGPEGSEVPDEQPASSAGHVADLPEPDDADATREAPAVDAVGYVPHPADAPLGVSEALPAPSPEQAAAPAPPEGPAERADAVPADPRTALPEGAPYGAELGTPYDAPTTAVPAPEPVAAEHVPAAPADVPAPAEHVTGSVAAEPTAPAAPPEPPQPVAAEPVAPDPVEHDRMDDVPAAFVDVVLALGSNLGDAQETLRDAIQDLDRISGLEITEVSPLARTAAVGGPDQPDFLNAVLLARTRLAARDLLHACQAVEQAHGRVRDERWGPRTLDVDLIVYGSLTAVADDLELPHPRAHERAFVLEPWSQIDPDAVLPGLGGGPVAALAATAPDRGGIRWLALDWLTDAAPEGGTDVATGSTDATAQAPAAVPVDPPDEPSPAAPRAFVPPAPGPAPVPPAVQEHVTRRPVFEAPAQEQAAPSQEAPQPVPPPRQVGPQQVAPQQPPAQQQPAHQPPPQQAPPQAGAAQPPVQQPASGASLPVAPPQTHVQELRPVFAPVSDGVAQVTQDDPAAPAVPPFPAPGATGPEQPAHGSAPAAAPAFSPVSAPADPVFSPVNAPADPGFGPASAPADAAFDPVAPAAERAGDTAPTEDGIIRSVPFAPVSGGTPASAPGPLADSALHPAADPWPPFPPVSGTAPDAQR